VRGEEAGKSVNGEDLPAVWKMVECKTAVLPLPDHHNPCGLFRGCSPWIRTGIPVSGKVGRTRDEGQPFRKADSLYPTGPLRFRSPGGEGGGGKPSREKGKFLTR